MGVLGKDLFDIDRPRTHVKVQFGQNAYWLAPPDRKSVV